MKQRLPWRSVEGRKENFVSSKLFLLDVQYELVYIDLVFLSGGSPN
jgi:hypothetical protein